MVKAFMDDNRDFNNPRGRIIIDDGRRFLRRTREKFDIIIIDPPPPAEQPTSSLLSSTEFYSLLKEHLKPGGIVQAWYGHIHAEPAIGRAFTQSLKESFSHIKIYRAIDDYPFQSMWGLHFICSDEPVPDITTEEFLRKLPAEARQDLKDMFFYVISDEKMEAMVSELLSRKIPIEKLLLKDPSEKITDDRPFNEYFLIRRYRDSIKKNQLNTD
ncbi:MAG: spermidine synthase [Candidatus Xenobiia bacterium LiM19]